MVSIRDYDFLNANSRAYEFMVGRIRRPRTADDAESTLSRITTAAKFAAEYHPGRFADGALENILLELGEKLPELPLGARLRAASNPSGNSRRILHVASEVVGIGGLTRMLNHWVLEDFESLHSVVLIDQRQSAVPDWLLESVRMRGGDLLALPHGSMIDKARMLRAAAVQVADLVVLHHVAFDVIPTLAFACRKLPTVAVLNHADHQFWLGSSVADLAVNLRTAGSIHTRNRRYISRNTVVPVPLADEFGTLAKAEARSKLGIASDQTVLLSVGRSLKYRPHGPFDFVATSNRILKGNSNAHLYVVGVSASEIAPFLREAPHERIHFVGSLENPSVFRAAADIYLESFPFGSQTALLEAALAALPVVPAYTPLFELLVSNDDAINDLLDSPQDEDEYVDHVKSLISDPHRRMEHGESLRRRLLIDHVSPNWRPRLSGVYQISDGLDHGSQPIPIGQCEREQADIGMSLWHVMADGRSPASAAKNDCGELALLRHSAFVAKYAGDFGSACRYSLQAIGHGLFSRHSWRLLFVSIVRGMEALIARAATIVGSAMLRP